MSPQASADPEIKRYLRDLGFSNPDRVRAAREALAALGAPALEALIAVLPDQSEEFHIVPRRVL